ncbi:MAG: hypothetical protein NC247_02085 [Ruminococcus flavefaciens]|nr:hypothetical protein [Ruminococcus flavefaciens]
MDNLRICEVKGFNAPPDTIVTFQGNEVGRVIRSDREGICQIAINSDIIHQWIRSNEYSFSLEVVHK